MPLVRRHENQACNTLVVHNGSRLEETIFSVLEPYLDQNYHVYQDNYYNSAETGEHLLSRQVSVCGTIRVNRGLPPDLKKESKSLKCGATTFRRKGDYSSVLEEYLCCEYDFHDSQFEYG
jgi:hypothetical protein